MKSCCRFSSSTSVSAWSQPTAVSAIKCQMGKISPRVVRKCFYKLKLFILIFKLAAWKWLLTAGFFNPGLGVSSKSSGVSPLLVILVKWHFAFWVVEYGAFLGNQKHWVLHCARSLYHVWDYHWSTNTYVLTTNHLKIKINPKIFF